MCVFFCVHVCVCGGSNILPEMLKVWCRNNDFRGLIVDPVKIVWEDGIVPKEWVDAIIIPIPNKGNSTVVTTGMVLHCWKSWEKMWLGSFRVDCRV